MWATYRFFVKRSLERALWFLAISVLGGFVLPRLHFPAEIFGCLVFCGGILYGVIAHITAIPANVSWVLCLPMSKRRIVVLNYLTNVTSWLIVGAATLLALGSVCVLNGVGWKVVVGDVTSRFLMHTQQRVETPS
jgi:hypothetical protein